MTDDRQPGLDRIWQDVSREIRVARRLAAVVRRLWRALPVATGLVLLALVWWHGRNPVPRPVPPPVRVAAWTVQGVRAAVGMAEEYPVVRGTRVLAVGGEGDAQRVTCVHRHTGKLLWRSALAFSECRLAADRSRLYLLARTNDAAWCVAALSLDDGCPVWTREAGRFPMIPPSSLTVVGDGVCWSVGHDVVMSEAATGVPRWRRVLAHGGTLSTPIAVAGEVIVSTGTRLTAMDAWAGVERWHCRLSGRNGSWGARRPLITTDGRHVLVSVAQGWGRSVLTCLEADTRELVWQRQIQAPASLRVAGDQLLVRSRELSALELTGGVQLWNVPIGGCGTLSVQGGRIYLADAEEKGRVVVLDRRTGRRLRSQSVAGSCSGVVVANGMGFISGNDGCLVAFPVRGRIL